MGALGLAAVLAVALAALRGTAGAITDWRQRRMERATEAAPLRAARVKLAEARMRAEQAGLGSGGAGGRRVPSSQEYGRRTLNRGSGGGGGGGGGRSGGGSSGGHRSPSSGGTGPGRKHNGPGKGPGSGLHNGPSPKNGKGHGKGNGSGSGSGSGSGGSGTSGGGHGSGKKDRKDRGSNGSGKGGGTESGGRTPGTLGQLALERSRRRTERQRAADKRAERQQKADLKDKRRDGDDAPKKDGAKDRSSDKPVSLSKDKPERVTLTRAVAAETFRRAADRLKKRRERISPTIRRVPTEGDAAPDAATGTDDTGTEKDTSSSAPTADETTATGPTEDTGTGSADTSAATDGTAATEAGEPGPAPDADAGYVSGEDFWEEPADADDFGPEAGEPWEPPGGGGRRNAWDSLFEAMWSAEVTWSVEQDGPATSHAPRWEPAALASAPESAAADTAAGTVTLIKEARVSAPIRLPSSAPAMAPEHATEVTLDQVVGFLDEVYGEAFATHDECLTLKVRARQLHQELEALAQELASTHNVVGRLTSTAMHKLSDSMDLAARKSEEMAVEALTAAESVERAKTDMDDAYRSIQQAAADAGLRTPSARVHNTD